MSDWTRPYMRIFHLLSVFHSYFMTESKNSRAITGIGNRFGWTIS